MLNPGKTDFRTNERQKRASHGDKGSLQQERVTLVNMYSTEKQLNKQQMFKDLKRETGSNTVMGGDFNITHCTVHPDMKPTGLTWHVRAGGPDLSIYESFQLEAEDIFFPRAQETFSRISRVR